MLKGFKNENVTRPDGSLNDLYDYIKPKVERIARSNLIMRSAAVDRAAEKLEGIDEKSNLLNRTPSHSPNIL